MIHFTSIRRKITFALMGLTSLALFLAGAAIFALERHAYRAGLVEDLTVLTRVVAINSTAALAFDDAKAANETLSAFWVAGSVASARLIRNDGVVFATYVAPGEIEQRFPKGVSSSEFSDGLLFLSEPVRVNGQGLGMLQVVSTLAPFDARMQRFLLILIGILFSVGLMVLLLAQRIQRPISDPILRLAEVAGRVSHEEDYSLRAEAAGGDEVATLIEGFNHMLGRIEERDLELSRHRLELERRVEERTHELLEAKEAAENALEIRNVFLANISHELRTPMHAILNFADLGRQKMEKGKPEKIPRYLENIGQAGRRLLKLLNELLDLAKLEAGRMIFEFAEHDLGRVIRGAVDECRSLFSSNEVELRCELDEGIRLTVDRDRIVQTVLNVLSNAVRFSPAGACVEIELHQAEDRAVVTIRDHGPGIPAEELETVFEKFIQASSTRSGAGGTGLGLAICKEVVAAHQGSIWASNHPDGGAQFIIELPMQLTESESSRDLETSVV